MTDEPITGLLAASHIAAYMCIAFTAGWAFGKVYITLKKMVEGIV